MSIAPFLVYEYPSTCWTFCYINGSASAYMVNIKIIENIGCIVYEQVWMYTNGSHSWNRTAGFKFTHSTSGSAHHLHNIVYHTILTTVKIFYNFVWSTDLTALCYFCQKLAPTLQCLLFYILIFVEYLPFWLVWHSIWATITFVKKLFSEQLLIHLKFEMTNKFWFEISKSTWFSNRNVS